jgi:hypothetical protein
MIGVIRKYLIIVLVNIIMALAILLIVDLFFGNWPSYFKHRLLGTDVAERLKPRPFARLFEECPDRFTHHGYCPEMVKRTELGPEDGGGVVLSYINRSKIRVAAIDQVETETDVSAYDVINLGDSMIQADEIQFEKTLGHVIESRTRVSVLDVGYGSWAPVLEYGWLRQQELKRGAQVNLFVMNNDLLPVYDVSNAGYTHRGAVDGTGNMTFGVFLLPSLREVLFQNSAVSRFFHTAFKELSKLGRRETSLRTYQLFSATIDHPRTDCSEIDEFKHLSPYTRAEVMMAFDPQCWDDETQAGIESAVSDIVRIARYVDGFDGKTTVFMTPMPHSFPNENIHGRAHLLWNIGATAVLSTDSVTGYLRERLEPEGIAVISLEDVIETLKKDKPGNYYFPRDGHWNERAHEAIGTWMAETFFADSMAKQ